MPISKKMVILGRIHNISKRIAGSFLKDASECLLLATIYILSPPYFFQHAFAASHTQHLHAETSSHFEIRIITVLFEKKQSEYRTLQFSIALLRSVLAHNASISWADVMGMKFIFSYSCLYFYFSNFKFYRRPKLKTVAILFS